MKKAILFLKAYSRYNAGEVAGFDVDTADALIAGRIAKPYVAPVAQHSAPDLSGGAADAKMEEVRAFALREEKRLQSMADGIQQREIDTNAKLDARTRDVEAREEAVAKREAALDQGKETGAAGGAKDTVIAADQKGPMPPNGATPPTGEGRAAEGSGSDEAKDDLPVQGAAKKGK